MAGGGGETPTALRGVGGTPLLQAQPKPPSPGGLGPPQGFGASPGGLGPPWGIRCLPSTLLPHLKLQGPQNPILGSASPRQPRVRCSGGQAEHLGTRPDVLGGGFRNPGPAGGLHVALTQKEPSPRLPQGLAPRAGAWAAKEAEMSPAAPRRPCSPRAPASCLRHPLSTRIRGPAPPGERAASLPGGRAASRVAASTGCRCPRLAPFLWLGGEGWAAFPDIILAIIPAARKIYGVRWRLCKIINKGRQYNLAETSPEAQRLWREARAAMSGTEPGGWPWCEGREPINAGGGGWGLILRGAWSWYNIAARGRKALGLPARRASSFSS